MQVRYRGDVEEDDVPNAMSACPMVCPKRVGYRPQGAVGKACDVSDE